MRGAWRSVRMALVLGWVIGGCQLLPSTPVLTCVDLPRVECERQAARLVDEARKMQPPKRVVSIRLTLHDGGEVLYDDGTGMSWIP